MRKCLTNKRKRRPEKDPKNPRNAIIYFAEKGSIPTSKLQKTWSTDQNNAAVWATSFIPIFTGICKLTQAGTKALIISGLRWKVGSFRVWSMDSELTFSSENWTVAFTLRGEIDSEIAMRNLERGEGKVMGGGEGERGRGGWNFHDGLAGGLISGDKTRGNANYNK